MRIIKTAKDIYGKVIKVGDKVVAHSIYDPIRYNIIGIVTQLHHQGKDGAIVTTNISLDPVYKHNNTHIARYCEKVN